jgi:hypothetical protein
VTSPALPSKRITMPVKTTSSSIGSCCCFGRTGGACFA